MDFASLLLELREFKSSLDALRRNTCRSIPDEPNALGLSCCRRINGDDLLGSRIADGNPGFYLAMTNIGDI